MEPEETQEGQKPAGRFTPRVFLVLGTIGVVVIVVLAGLVVLTNKSEPEPEGITAMEGKDAADNIAFNWSDTAALIRIHKCSSMTDDGKFVGWYYTYIQSMDMPLITKETNCIYVLIYENGTYSTDKGAIGEDLPIKFLKIDSNTSYQIARENIEINRFLSHKPSIYGFFLSNATGTPTWYIEWTYDAGFDNPKWANIQIDAITGEVLYVEADT